MKQQTKQLRAVGYCRTSGEGQRDNTSIPNQRTTIEAFCKTKEWKFTKHYVDESISGSKIDGRDAFKEMLRDAALEKFDIVVVFDVSRFARDGCDILGQAKFLQALNIHVVDSKGQFDSRPGGNTLLNFVYAGVSEWERLKIMERMVSGRIARAKAGEQWSAKKPFGRDFPAKVNGHYPNGASWTVNERGLRMRQMLERYAAGESLNDLLKEFTEFSSSHVVLHAVRSSQLSGVYVKEFNIADLNIKGLKIPIPAIPEVISPQLEARVRARMDHCRTWNKESLRSYLLTGFVRCGHCGHALSGNTTRGVKYYRHHTDKTGCVFHAIRAEKLVEPVLDYLYHFFTDEPTFNAAVANALPNEDELAALQKERDAVQRSLAKTDKEIRNLVDAIVKGINPTLLIGKQTELTAGRDSDLARLADIDTKLSAMPDAKTVQHDAMAIRLDLLRKVRNRAWRQLKFDDVRRFLVFLFGQNSAKTGDGITVAKEKGRWRIAFKGRVGFYHDIVGGRAVSHLVTAAAARHNKAVVDLGHQFRLLSGRLHP